MKSKKTAAFLFTASASLLFWNLIGYPLFLTALAAAKKKRSMEKNKKIELVSVLIAAHNEEGCIGRRIENIFSNGSSRDIEIIVVSDGSTDATASIAKEKGAIVIETERTGKISALQKAVKVAKGDAFVITDANTIFEAGAIDALVDVLEDSGIGIAAGDMILEDEYKSASSQGENAYWNYETFIKKKASDAGMLLMGAGGIYAVRREDWPDSIPLDFADDSYVPLMLFRSGRTNLFVSNAKAREKAGATMKEEWKRRIRGVAQDTRVALELDLGMPNYKTFFALFSQKILRWNIFPLSIISLLTAKSASEYYISRKRFRLLFRLLRHLLPAVSGLLCFGMVRKAQGKDVKTLSALIYLVGASVSAFAGMCLGLAGYSKAIWDKAESTRS